MRQIACVYKKEQRQKWTNACWCLRVFDLPQQLIQIFSTWYLIQKPFGKQKLKIPDSVEIQLRLAFCSHYKNLEELQNDPDFEYLCPDLGKFTSSDILEKYEDEYNQPIKLSVISTYLARFTSKNKVERAKKDLSSV